MGIDISNIIIAVLALIGTLVGTIIANNKTTAVIEEKIRTLSEKVEKHNSIVERTYKLESDVKNISDQVDEIKADVKELATKLH